MIRRINIILMQGGDPLCSCQGAQVAYQGSITAIVVLVRKKGITHIIFFKELPNPYFRGILGTIIDNIQVSLREIQKWKPRGNPALKRLGVVQA
jgi:hypothetical protein